MKQRSAGLLLAITACQLCVAADAPRQIELGNIQALNFSDPYAYAARASFSRPQLSPDGKRAAFVVRMADSVMSLAVVDISGETAIAKARVSVERMQGIRNFGWVSNDQLVLWIDIDTSYSSDDNPISNLYIAQWNLATGKVTERPQPVRMPSDNAPPYPISSDLVRSPWKQPFHALISECRRQGGIQFRSRGDEANFTFASMESLPSNTITCELLDWNMQTNRASTIARPFYAYPTKFYVSAVGTRMKAEGRQLGGKIMHASWDAKRKKWLKEPNLDQTLLGEEYDSGEEDYAALWKRIHEILPQDLEPAGAVVKTATEQRPVGIQLSAPTHDLLAFNRNLAQADTTVTAGFAKMPAAAGTQVSWHSMTDDEQLGLLSVSDVDNAGAYFFWRQTDRSVLWISSQRQLPANSIAATTFENWMQGGSPLGVTRPLAGRVSKALVIIPVVASEEAAPALLRTFDLTAQWFAANALTVVHVPVGLPEPNASATAAEAWRMRAAERIAEAREQALSQLRLNRQDPVCLFGRETAGYAALAASTHGIGFDCVLTVNVRLDPAAFAKPYNIVTTTSKTWYVGNNNTELRSWRSMYGADLLSGSPLSWSYNPGMRLFTAFEMFDENRPLATFAKGFIKSVEKAGAEATLYAPVNYASKPDQWLSNFYDDMLRFILPPEKPRDRNKGKITVEPLQEIKPQSKLIPAS